MRLLLEKARFTPFKLRYKVYIIDEAHMLTSEAASMLLKTLEEPPEYMVFMLATTEPQKIPATIISRCQRFDFRRLRVTSIVERLTQILSCTGKSIDEGGLHAIASAADGSMRDALSLADQCLSFCGHHVAENDVYDVLGSMHPDFLFNMADALLESDAAKALLLLDEVVKGGRDIGVFTSSLTQHFRALLLVKACNNCADLLECTSDTLERYYSQAKICSQLRLLRALELLSRTQNDLKWIKLPRILLETALVRICLPENEQNFLALSERISRIEASLQNKLHSAYQEKVLPAEITIPDMSFNKDLTTSTRPETPEQKQDIPMSFHTDNPKAVEQKQLFADAGCLESFSKAKANDDARYAPAWCELCKALQLKNFALFQNAKNAASAMLYENTLCVMFSPEFEADYNSLNAKKSFELLKKLLEEHNPNLQLCLKLS